MYKNDVRIRCTTNMYENDVRKRCVRKMETMEQKDGNDQPTREGWKLCTEVVNIKKGCDK